MKNPRNAGRKPVPDGVLVKTTVPKSKVNKLKKYSKELIKEYQSEKSKTQHNENSNTKSKA